eukprot:2331996-Prymnesium_polylepis.1
MSGRSPRRSSQHEEPNSSPSHSASKACRLEMKDAREVRACPAASSSRPYLATVTSLAAWSRRSSFRRLCMPGALFT